MSFLKQTLKIFSDIDNFCQVSRQKSMKHRKKSIVVLDHEAFSTSIASDKT